MASLPSVLVGDECAFIPLTRGQVAIVDVGDYHWLSQWKWQAYWSKTSHSFYATRNHKRLDGSWTTVQMHREILGLQEGDKLLGDHVEPSRTLDNRRSNLRIATKAQNTRNGRRRSTNTSGFKGVTFDKFTGKWLARLVVDGKAKNLGRYASPDLAFAAYCEAASIYHGEFARTA